MTAEGMTSISVSYEVRRQPNTLRTLSGYKSVKMNFSMTLLEHTKSRK